MSKIVIVNLTQKTINEENYNYSEGGHYGRGLAMELLEKYTGSSKGRLHENNALVIAPGLFAGNRAPCAGRAVLMAKGEGVRGLAVSNFTGDFPQKLASLNIAALVITGKYAEGNAAVLIDREGVRIESMPKLQGMYIPEIVDELREDFGKECALWGVGKAADFQLPLSGYFVTYPEGEPRFHCPRSGFGDVAGSKGLRVIIVKCGKYFDAPCVNALSFQEKGRRLTSLITKNEICGVALPGLGSITLLHLLKNRQELPEVKGTAGVHKKRGGGRMNYCCAPMCVIGCLNRHSANDSEFYSAPEESEVRAALESQFGDGSFSFAKELNRRGFSIGLNTTEFVYTAGMYFEALNQKAADGAKVKEKLFSLMDEIENGTAIGRLIGSGTPAVSSLYRDRPGLLNKVTRPSSFRESQFRVKLCRFYPELNDISDMELLYRQVFLLENLGICIFSSFALLNNQEALELLASMASDRLGREVSLLCMLEYAGKCIERETEYQYRSLSGEVHKNIPEFIKVLYQYFEA